MTIRCENQKINSRSLHCAALNDTPVSLLSFRS
jgi:hypothetical protein